MRKALLLSVILVFGSSAAVFSQETVATENEETNSKVLESKIAAMQAELTALKQQLASEAESKQDVPPPPPTPAPNIAPSYGYSQARPEYQPREFQPQPTVVERPVYVQVPQPVYQTPVFHAPYYQTPYYCPNSYGYGYGGVGIAVGGVNVGFYPSIGFGFGF